MNLVDLYINGFGLFHDVRVEGLSSGLTVFLGDNESGKSTLLGFIRAILFGFPDGRSSDNPYPPLSGGRHGGNIALSPDGKDLYVVERYPGSRGGKVDVLNPDHTRSGKELLSRLLGIGNKVLFKNIYAFSLSELQNFETLNTESVREALYSAGAGIDPHLLASLKSTLEKKEDALFKPGGTKPELNRILARLKALLKEKKGLGGSVDEYDRIRSRIFHLTEEIDTLEKRKTDLSIQLKKNEQLLGILPEWINLSLARQKLEELDPVESFPHQGLARLEGLNSRLGDLHAELLKKEEELKRQESELPVIKSDPEILNHSSSIRQLQRDQGHFEAVVQDLISTEQELSGSEQRLKDDLNRLGPSWTEGRLLEFDLSITTREEVRRHREILGQARLEEQRKRDLLEDITTRKRETAGLLRDMNEPPIKDTEQLRKMKRSCGKLKNLESRDRLFDEELRHVHEHLQDLKEEKEILEEIKMQETDELPFWPIPVSIGAGLVSFIWLGSVGELRWATLVSGVLFFFALVLWRLRTRIDRMGGDKGEKTDRRFHLLIIKIDEAEARGADLQARLDHLREQMVAECSILSLSEVPSGESLERMEQDLEEQIRQLDHWKETSEKLQQIKKRYEEATSALKNTESEATKALGTWQEWLNERGLDPVLSPDGVLETLSLIQSCKEQVEGLNRLRSRMKIFNESMEGYHDLANRVLRSCGRKPVRDREIQVAVHNLVHDFRETEQAAQKSELLFREIEASTESIGRLKSLIKDIQKEIQGLMFSGGAEDEEQFRNRAQIFDKRFDLKQEIERSEDSIKRLSHNLGRPEKIMEDFSKVDLDELEDQKISLCRELEETETTLDLLKKEQAKLEEQTRQLINDERISTLRAEEEGLKKELSLKAEEWITIKLAQRLLRMARARYEKERQPEVISEAGRFFNHLSLGRYRALAAPIGENRIEVVCQDNSRKEIGQLSRGTAEQLYLSLRFGFISEFSKRSNSLPIIMDEILVNFDLPRARATVKGIIELSRKHQILFFTCHPETTALFRERDSDTPVLKIIEGEVRDLDEG